MASVASRAIAVALASVAFACSGGTKYIGANPELSACVGPASPPPDLSLDAFYAKYLNALGVPVVSSAYVSDAALERACDIAVHVLAERADVRAAMIQRGMRVAVMGRDEVTTDLPEYNDLYATLPGTDWDRETRSLGANLERPVSSAAEENLLCLGGDPYAGESLLVHSLAHGLRRLGIVAVDAAWDERLLAAYRTALARGLWADTYAATDREQYWAEGVQDWYDANKESVPANGVHNDVNTRSELKAYDPALAELIAEYVPDDAFRPLCP